MLLRLVSTLLTLALASCISGQSSEDYAETRRQKLLEMYPVGKTTQKDIATRFGHAPEVARTRPAKGWEAEQDWWIRSYATKAEQRIHRKIPKLERYFGGDGLFSLCYCWFYYDSRDRLIDAEWQWSSD